ncbi:MAG: glycerol-3-phosphate 1-O-acyltransferase PlsY [Oscillospiraceae bacterium]|nr:glycerol-3-phosphate 1-O-acyltransferase PlsY [Oscillospiraceae bacterium]
MTFLLFIAIALGSYFLGGLNGALITSRLVYRQDIRNHGSGNPGLTNFYRTYGGQAIFLVILIDILKTAIPVVVGGSLLESYAAFGTVEERVAIGRVWGGLFAMLGHAYPCLDKFRGGKCVLAGGTVALFLDWRVALIVLGAFFLVVLLTRYVSLGSLTSAVLFPVSFIFLGYNIWAILLAALCGALIVYRHTENIERLLRREERKIRFRRKRSEDT